MTFLKLFIYRLIATPTFRRHLSSVLSKIQPHKKFILVGCHPLDGVTRGGPPSDATAWGYADFLYLLHKTVKFEYPSTRYSNEYSNIKLLDNGSPTRK